MQRPQPKRANQPAKPEVSPEVEPNEAKIKNITFCKALSINGLKWPALLDRTSLKALSIQHGFDQDGNAKSEESTLNTTPRRACKNSPLGISPNSQ
jgi:hypothetical protein